MYHRVWHSFYFLFEQIKILCTLFGIWHFHLTLVVVILLYHEVIKENPMTHILVFYFMNTS